MGILKWIQDKQVYMFNDFRKNSNSDQEIHMLKIKWMNKIR